ncbi:hypothetical protein BGZ63DRAFT_325817, partial [Mariannaea sp. PMI_226]
QRKTKVKSGCRTCKVRKVKCDEGRPACHRCVSTGRRCDGYGIWGGGGNHRTPSRPVHKDNISIIPRPARHIAPHSLNAAECKSFEWFALKTVTKLKGLFRSTFWDRLVFQACYDEPAVRHAVLALSTVQKRDTSGHTETGTKALELDDEEQFVLRQYGKAISHLVPQSPGDTQPHVNVVLLTCLVFIFLEFLRGHYSAAQAHLKNGLRLIAESLGPQGMKKPGLALLRPATDGQVEEGILEAFSRIQVQVALLTPFDHPFGLRLQVDELDPVNGHFKSIEQARERLDRILNEIIQIEQDQRRKEGEDNSDWCSEMHYKHERILCALDTWQNAYNLSTVTMMKRMPFREVFAFRLLKLYHTMGKIMINVICHSSFVAAYDQHSEDFRSIVTGAEDLRLMLKSVTIMPNMPNHLKEKSQSIADIGWIPPLYYTALKCRDRTIRIQAIDLLRFVPHREGIWDSTMAASIAEKVMAIEEGLHVEASILHTNLDFGAIWDMSSVTESCKIQDVRIRLPDNPDGNVGLGYRGLKANW